MEPPAQPPDIDLIALTDEELVLAARDPERRQAVIDALVARHYDWLCRLIAHRARRARLPRDLVPDAQQDAALAVVLAIPAYDPVQKGKSRHCTFRSFLWRVLRARFYNFVRGFRRGEQRLDRSCQAEETQPEGAPPGPHSARCNSRPKRRRSAAWTAADRAEFRSCLEKALRQLTVRARWLWKQSEAGRSLAALARQLGISPDRAKRWWRAIRAWLAEQLRDWNGEPLAI
jgi:RNA polymerase sigma factor (sigma-70 family)